MESYFVPGTRHSYKINSNKFFIKMCKIDKMRKFIKVRDNIK